MGSSFWHVYLKWSTDFNSYDVSRLYFRIDRARSSASAVLIYTKQKREASSIVIILTSVVYRGLGRPYIALQKVIAAFYKCARNFERESAEQA